MTGSSESSSVDGARVGRGRSGWRWFPVAYLVFLAFPTIALVSKSRPWYEYLWGSLVLLGFVAVFLQVFWIKGERTEDLEKPLRVRSIIGWALSYVGMALMWPLIGSDGLGFLIYGASMAGYQAASWPMFVSVLIAALGFGGDALLEGIPALAVVFNLVFALVAGGGTHLGFLEIVAARRLHKSQEEVARIAKVAERERIARDLHDLLGHTLSVIVLKSELASRLAERDPARAAQEIKDVERIARESLQEVRSAVRGYRSAGLEAELGGVRLACEAAGLKLELYLEPLELEWASEQAFSFVLRESITNVIRYANAKTVWVSLERNGGQARLSVWDDGAGRINEGNGVRGMRERLEAIGGRLEVSHAFKGVTACLPLGAPSSAETESATLEPRTAG
jgi:two-component system sensor histidine kinase DesK